MNLLVILIVYGMTNESQFCVDVAEKMKKALSSVRQQILSTDTFITSLTKKLFQSLALPFRKYFQFFSGPGFQKNQIKLMLIFTFFQLKLKPFAYQAEKWPNRKTRFIKIKSVSGLPNWEKIKYLHSTNS
jgi:hypothetical protein